MRLFIDGEWNSYLGELISFAIVAEDGREWYECLNISKKFDAWVADNVVPKLGQPAISFGMFQVSLEKFLSQFDSIHIIADWPEDIVHFCTLLVTGPGNRLNTPPLTMEILRVDSVSDNPHNALADAHGLRKHVMDKEL